MNTVCIAAFPADARRLLASATGMALIVMLAIGSIATDAIAQTYTVDRTASDALTSYLREHRLPLVGASVSKASDGSSQVMLYGYVATEQGKRNAAKRAEKYFNNDPHITMVNRITVNPEIRELGSSSSEAAAGSPDAGMYAAPAGSAPAGTLTWDQVYREIQQGGIHPAPDAGDGSSSAW
ncbi:MAG TPA: hypothetical protein VMD75_06115 [Candidatus Binataceae bacterium]|nr:hypothetical protein [Candidatus Binataceae bacterium]